MRDENTVEPCYRYLIATGLVKNQTIEKACRSEQAFKTLGDSYINSVEIFLNRSKSANEIAVFTSYAYADFLVPRTYEIVFDYDNVDNFVETSFILQYSLNYAISFFFLNQAIDDGHRHICILIFENEIPSLLKMLKCAEDENADNKRIGFCQKIDFEAIRENIKQQRKENSQA
jgi:hypothetical protein